MDEESAELKKFRKELNGGAVSLVLLALLDAAGDPMYGYQIGRRLDELCAGAASGPLVKQGTLYPLLRTMESNGLLASEVEPSIAGPPRRYYTITSQGRQLLPLWRAAWTETRDFVDAVLGGGGTDNSRAESARPVPDNQAPLSTESAAGATAASGGDDRG
jgi:PadR family transcriptional regulator PadR